MLKRILMLMSLSVVLINTSCHSKKEESGEHTKFLVTSPAIADTVINKNYVCHNQYNVVNMCHKK